MSKQDQLIRKMINESLKNLGKKKTIKEVYQTDIKKKIEKSGEFDDLLLHFKNLILDMSDDLEISSSKAKEYLVSYLQKLKIKEY